MKGIITEINRTRGMVAVGMSMGGYSVFETSDDNFDVGDEIGWTEENPLGHCKITNITKNEDSDVVFQDHNVSASNLSNRMLY